MTRAATGALAFPIIDIAPLFDPNGDHAAVASAIDAACETIGFFGVRGHGVAPARIAALYEAAYEFFDLPLAE
jgi:isopenicillin N synthase-like dioxygenase